MNQQRKTESGQTLIETMVAIFIMAMGITSALGLASYAVSTSSNIVKQIIGMGLAREGVEAVKNMRDTNWLQEPQLETDCYSFDPLYPTASCFREWQTSYYNLDVDPGPSQSYVLSFDPGQEEFWSLTPEADDFSLRYTALSNSGYYNTSLGGVAADYFRRITLTEDSPGPYAQSGMGPRILVTSEVWWNDKRCPASDETNPPSSGSCKLKLQMYLTNWKNY